MSLPSGYKILAKGYEIRGDVRSGMSATIPFIMPWSNAFSFVNNLLPAPSAVSSNSIIWTPPYQFPLSISGRPAPPLYCQSYSCVPCGSTGTPAVFSGLTAGDFFSTALVTAEFSTPMMAQQVGDDPQGLNQLDPSNPLTYCEQSIQMTSKYETRKGAGYKWVSGSRMGLPLKGEFGVPMPEAKLVLKFPRIPVLPWQLFQPYIGKVNSVPMLNCVKGSLLLEGTPTAITPGTDGSIAQNLSMLFSFNPDPTGTAAFSVFGELIPTGMDWNKRPIEDQSGYALATSIDGSGNPIIAYADFRQIFYTLLTGQINTGL